MSKLVGIGAIEKAPSKNDNKLVKENTELKLKVDELTEKIEILAKKTLN